MSFNIGQIEVGLDTPLFVIAGPCVIEGLNSCLDTANALVEISRRTGVPIIFKASFDKANRSSIRSFRGVGMHEGLNILKRVREHSHLPVLTDIHTTKQASAASRFVDALQIPAFLCRQTDLLVACAKTGLPINVKKGQFMSPGEMSNVAEKIWSQKAATEKDKIMFTERGTFFGYNRLVNDMLAIPEMQGLGYPVIFDATHSIQQPGKTDFAYKIPRNRSVMLARAAVACGVNGLFFEVHPNPSESKSDSATILPLDWLEPLLVACKKIQEVPY